MSYRIDLGAKFRYDPAHNSTFPLSEQQQKAFLAQIDQAVRERASAGGPKQLDPISEKVVVVQPGDSLWKVAQENNVKFADILAANKSKLNGNSNLIRPNEVVIVPESSPELVVKSQPDGNGIPSGEKAFLDDLYGRGNKLSTVDGISQADYAAESQAIQQDAGAYLDSLPASQRQQAALRMAAYGWDEGGPAGQSVKTAITQRGLETNPEEAFAKHLYAEGNLGADSSDPNYDFKAEQVRLAGETKQYLMALPEAERGAALQRLFDRSWMDGGPAQGAIEGAARDMGIKLRLSGHNGHQVEGQARKIIDDANATGKPDEAFRSLNTAYAKASPEVRHAIDQSQDARGLISKAADWATERLKNYNPENAASDQGDAATVMSNLQRLTDGADPSLAVDLMASALPTIEAANAKRQEKLGGNLIGMNGLNDLMKIIDRIGGTPGADRIIDRFAALGSYNRNSIPPSVASGSRLDYPLAFAESLKTAPDYVSTEIVPNVSQFAKGTVNKNVDNYAAHMDELQWLIANHGPSMTPEQLAKAIEDYKNAKGPEWIKKEQDLEGKIVADGKKLALQLSQLGQLPPDLANQRKEPNGPTQQEVVNKQVADILADDKTYAALRVTLQKEPEILKGPVLDGLGTVLRLTDRGRKLVEEAATQIVRHSVIPSLADFDPANPASVQKAKQSLAAFKDGRMSKLLGIPQTDIDSAVKVIEKSFPAAGDTLADTQEKMRVLNRDLDQLSGRDGVRSFGNKTFPGQLLRFVGVAATGAGLVNSGNNFIQNPTWKGGLKFVIDLAGVSQRILEFSNGIGRISDSHGAVKSFGSSSRPAVKLLGALGAGFDVWNAIDYFKADDPLMGSLSLTAAGGTVMAALGTGTMFGPAGLIIVGGALIAQWIISENRENNKYETGTSKDFLAHSEMSPEVAQALVDQSGGGHSPVPLLMRYAELKGYNMDDTASRQKFFQWLNGIPKAGLETLRNNLHHTLDGFKGDVSKLTLTASSDPMYTRPENFKMEIEGIDFDNTAEKVRKGNANPSSAVQIDVALAELGISVPVA